MHNYISSKSEIHSRILYLRKFARLTRQYIEENYNISINTLRKWENGSLKIPAAKISILCYIYNSESVFVTEDWIKYGKGALPSFSPQIENKKKTQFSELMRNDDLLALEEIKALLDVSANNLVYMMLENDSMYPFYQEKTWIIGRKSDNIPSCVGKDCIIKIKDVNSFIFKRIISYQDFDKYTLAILNLNSKSIPFVSNVEIEYSAPVTWTRRIYDHN